MVHNIKDLVADYGPICGVYIGSKKLVVIADLDMLKGKTRTNFLFLEDYFLSK